MRIMQFIKQTAAALVIAATVFTGCKKDDPAKPIPMISITTQPGNASVTAGSITGSLSVAASVTEGKTAAYQWYNNTSASNTGGTAVSGATDASFAITATLAVGTYWYFCEVAAEGAKSVRSAVATAIMEEKTVDVPGSETDIVYSESDGSMILTREPGDGKNGSWRMDYKSYRQRGLRIGSGAIEATHRNVIQKRLKLFGQRWTGREAQNILNLSACRMSGRWDKVVEPVRNTAV